jgi:hypothetical protein
MTPASSTQAKNKIYPENPTDDSSISGAAKNYISPENRTDDSGISNAAQK